MLDPEYWSLDASHYNSESSIQYPPVSSTKISTNIRFTNVPIDSRKSLGV